jgi:hypothetical protein
MMQQNSPKSAEWATEPYRMFKDPEVLGSETTEIFEFMRFFRLKLCLFLLGPQLTDRKNRTEVLERVQELQVVTNLMIVEALDSKKISSSLISHLSSNIERLNKLLELVKKHRYNFFPSDETTEEDSDSVVEVTPESEDTTKCVPVVESPPSSVTPPPPPVRYHLLPLLTDDKQNYMEGLIADLERAQASLGELEALNKAICEELQRKRVIGENYVDDVEEKNTVRRIDHHMIARLMRNNSLPEDSTPETFDELVAKLKPIIKQQVGNAYQYMYELRLLTQDLKEFRKPFDCFNPANAISEREKRRILINLRAEFGKNHVNYLKFRGKYLSATQRNIPILRHFVQIIENINFSLQVDLGLDKIGIEALKRQLKETLALLESAPTLFEEIKIRIALES